VGRSITYFFTISLFAIGSIGSLFAQRPEPIQDEQMTPIIDSLELERTNVEFLITEGMHFLSIENQTKALNSFLKAHELMPENAAVNSKIAEIYQQSEEYDNALFYAVNANQQAPENHFYAALLANIQTETGDLSGAINTYEELYENSDDAPDDYLLELAALYIYNNQPSKALKTYDRIENRLGILEEVSIQKQKILLKQNKLKEAIAEGDKLVKAFPHVGNYAVDLAQIMISNDKADDAVEYLTNYLDENNNQPVAHLELAELLIQRNLYDQASIHLRKAFESEEISLQDKLNNFVPLVKQLNDREALIKELGKILVEVHAQNSNAYAANGDLYFSLDQKDSALFFYRKAVEFNASNMQLWQNILNLELEAKNYEKVANYAEEALTYFPNQPVIYLFGGTAYFSMKKYQQAINMWKQGKNMVFGNDQLKSTFSAQMADALHASKQYKEAFEAYEEAIKANPNNYFAINNYAYYSSLKKQNLERVKKLSKRMIEANPENATFLDTYGWVLFQMEEYDVAEKQLKKAAEINPSGTIVEHYGDVLFKLGNTKEALTQWQKAKEIGGASDRIDKKIQDKQFYE
jgi:tetratricopeptide (TPR) repeat protein